MGGITVLLSLITNALLQAFRPWLYIKYKQGENTLINIVNNQIVVGVCLATLIIITLGPEAIKILGAQGFWEAKWVVMPIAIGGLFQFIYNSYSGLELYHKKTMVIAAGTIFTAIINYFLNSTFIPLYGYTAAAYTTLVSYLILAVFHLVAYTKVTKIRVYDDKFIWAVAIFTSAICFVVVQLYEHFYLRYMVLVIVLLGVGITQRRSMITFYKRVFNSHQEMV